MRALIPLLAAAAWVPVTCFGIIFSDTGDPEYHATTPGNAQLATLWDLQGNWGGFTGTPIGENLFITAKHLGLGVGSSITFASGSNIGTYVAVESWLSPTTDLQIVRVEGTFTSWATLATAGAFDSSAYAVFGRGTERGAAYTVGTTRGYEWGAATGQLRWGQGTIDGVVGSGTETYFYDFFTSTGGVGLSVGDSGGGLFRLQGGQWVLAGINYGVTGPYNTTASAEGAVNATLYNTAGLYQNSNGVWVASTTPTYFVASNVVSDMAWITSVPEPSTWALMGLGAVGLGLQSYRRRRVIAGK